MRDKQIKRKNSKVEDARIVDVTIENAEKRREPRKHYVFCVTVAWADGTVNIIYRRYSHFHNLHACLQNEFRAEAGSKKPSERILPFFPGRVLFGRTQKTALKRLQPLDEYCKSLIHLPHHISRSPCVVQFFQPTEDDVIKSLKNPRKPRQDRKFSVDSIISSPIPVETYIAIAAFQRENKDQLSLEPNVHVDVIDKSDTGWWLVSTDDGQGWVPSSYLEMLDGVPDETDVIRFKDGQEEKYIVISEYHPSFDDELTLKNGSVVQVIEKTMDGWWLVRQGGQEGRAPSTNLSRADTVKAMKALDKGVATHQTSRLRQMAPQSSTDPCGRQLDDYSIPASLQTALPPRRRSVKAQKYHRSVSKQSSIGATYVAVADFVSTGAAMSLQEGDTMTVLEKMNNNWCLVELSGDGEDAHTGWVPSTYIKPLASRQDSLDAASAPTVADEYEYHYQPPHGYYNVPGTEESSSRFSDVASSVGTSSMTSSSLDSPSTTDSDNTGPQLWHKPEEELANENSTSNTSWGGWRDGTDGSEHSSETSNKEALDSGISESSCNSDIPNKSSSVSDNGGKEDSRASNYVSPVWSPADVTNVEAMSEFPLFMARSNFTGSGTNETKLEQGEMVRVIEKSGQGWWLVRSKAGQGVVPSHFLRKPPSATAEAPPPSIPSATLLAPYKPKNIPASPFNKSPITSDIETNGQIDDGESTKSVNELLRMFNKVS